LTITPHNVILNRQGKAISIIAQNKVILSHTKSLTFCHIDVILNIEVKGRKL